MHPVIMPKLGLTMDEGTIIRWMKKEGETVEKGEILFEVETDKAVNEVESSFTGTLGKILYEEGDTLDVLTVIGYILEPDEDAPDEWPLPAPPTPAVEPVAALQAQGTSVRITPIASKLASEHGVDVTEIRGTGQQGTITKEDVLRYTEGQQISPIRHQRGIVASPRAKKLAREKGIALDGIRGSGQGGRITEQDVLSFIETQDLVSPSRFQQITAKRLTESFTTVPHFYLRVEVDASKLVDWRENLLASIEKATSARLTYTDMLILLVANILSRHPRVNASWVQGFIRLEKDINLGLAMAVEDGLVVPVIKNADQLTLDQIVVKRERLAADASAGKLGFSDLEGGTFTLTNLGMYGIDDFDAIINPPQSAVLAVGRIADRVIAENGTPVVKPTIRFSLSMDHRVLDGALAARFLDDLRQLIETPDEILERSISEADRS
ncbi:MAG: 2-oxo acid dehydrogenase subunit E2 [Anaerolineales bacterium]|nr:2-oxo acid dehydrogenase subunit E2 [Anaerolineales bacterium]